MYLPQAGRRARSSACRSSHTMASGASSILNPNTPTPSPSRSFMNDLLGEGVGVFGFKIEDAPEAMVCEDRHAELRARLPACGKYIAWVGGDVVRHHRLLRAGRRAGQPLVDRKH